MWFYVYVYVIDEYRIISQRSALSRRRSGLWRQRSHRARPHSGRDRAARRTAAHTVHLYPANNRGGAARRRVVIGTTWPRRRRKSAAAGGTVRACGRLCTMQVASFAIGRLGELQHWVGELGEVAEGGVG